jgi:DNA-binding NarL/FixJ family response regulator
MRFPEDSTQNGTTGTIPPRTIDDLLQLIPQEVAVNQGQAKRLGEITLVSCRDFTDEDAERLAALTRRQYQTLLLASEGLSYEDIGSGLGVQASTAQDYMEIGYAKLGGSSKVWATTFIPIEKTRLDDLPPTLPPRQLEIFHGLGDGLSQYQIASKLGMSDSTLRSHLLNMRADLGISTVALIRVAGATKNLNLARWASVDSGSDSKTKTAASQDS